MTNKFALALACLSALYQSSAAFATEPSSENPIRTTVIEIRNKAIASQTCRVDFVDPQVGPVSVTVEFNYAIARCGENSAQAVGFRNGSSDLDDFGGVNGPRIVKLTHSAPLANMDDLPDAMGPCPDNK